MFLESPAAPPEAADAEPGPPVEHLLGAYVRAAEGAFSANTERALKADLGIYTAWCAGQGRAALPASPDTIAAFVDAMAATRAPATVRRYVASFAVAHRAIGRAKTPRSPVVKLALQRMHRGKGRRQAQALGLTLHEIPPPGLGPDGTITVADEILIRSRRRAWSHPPGQSTFYVRSSGFWRFLRSCEKPSFFSMLWQCTNCRPLPGLHPGRGEIQLLTTTGPSGPFRRNSEPRPAAPIPPNLPPRIGGLLRR